MNPSQDVAHLSAAVGLDPADYRETVRESHSTRWALLRRVTAAATAEARFTTTKPPSNTRPDDGFVAPALFYGARNESHGTRNESHGQAGTQAWRLTGLAPDASAVSHPSNAKPSVDRGEPDFAGLACSGQQPHESASPPAAVSVTGSALGYAEDDDKRYRMNLSLSGALAEEKREAEPLADLLRRVSQCR